MNIKLNLEELIKIATNIELDGQAFYTKAAEFTTNSEAKDLFFNLSKWEKKHYQTFSSLLENIGSNEFGLKNDPMNEAALYLQEVLGGNIFSGPVTPEELAGNDPDNLDGILAFALEREKDSIIFYSSLDKVYGTKKLTPKIDIIIGEEISHVRYLHTIRKKLSNSLK